MIRLFSVLVLSMMVVSTSAQEKALDYSEALKLIEVWLDAQRDYDRVPGMSVIIVQDQDILWSGGFGMANMEEQVKATPSTLYSICSISKLFTSVAVMKLYDEGRLRLDDEIQDLLPWYDLPQQFEDSWPVTIRTLLTHSSGLPRESNHPYWTGPDFPFPSTDSLKSELKNQETLYPSSTYFQYSNLAMSLLGEVIEELSSMSYEDYIVKEILDPLSMHDTRTFLPEDQYGTSLAVGYSALDREGNRNKVNFFKARGITSAAGFSSNVTDLAKFASWQFRLMDTTSTEILKPSTLRHMHNVHWIDQDGQNSWGLGFGIVKTPDGERMVGHSGGCPGYNTLFSMVPQKKRAYAVFTNGLNTNRTGYVRGMHSLLEKYKKEAGKDNEQDQPPSLDEYQGYYHMLPWQSEIYLACWNNHLVMLSLPSEDPAGSMVKLKYVDKDIFRRVRDDGKPGETYTFLRDDQGSIVKFKRHNNYFTRINK